MSIRTRLKDGLKRLFSRRPFSIFSSRERITNLAIIPPIEDEELNCFIFDPENDIPIISLSDRSYERIFSNNFEQNIEREPDDDCIIISRDFNLNVPFEPLSSYSSDYYMQPQTQIAQEPAIIALEEEPEEAELGRIKSKPFEKEMKELGLIKSSGRYYGEIRGSKKNYRIYIKPRGSGKYEIYVKNPPNLAGMGLKMFCFIPKSGGWRFVHFTREHDPITQIETLRDTIKNKLGG